MRSDHVMPFYVLCDESFSMMDHIDALNDGLTELHRTVCADAAVVARTRFCLIGFSGSAKVLLPLSRLSEITDISVLTAGAQTNFGAAFTLLRRTIERDLAALAARCHTVSRPAVFFLSDGQPTDPATWPRAFTALIDPTWPGRPDMIAFGIGDSDRATIGRIGTFRAFTGRDNIASRGFARALTESIMRSGNGSPGTLHVPDHVSGFTTVRDAPA